MMIIEAARAYIERGLSVIPIPYGQKGPILKGWQKARIKNAEEWFSENNNIGVLTGQASGIVCVDLDHPRAVELAPEHLPTTGMIAGRTTGGKVHWFYRVEGEFKKVAFTSGCGKKVVEILGDGQQVVVGPSVHPNGDVYDMLEGSATHIDAGVLIECCQDLANAVYEAEGLQKPEQKKAKPNTSIRNDFLVPSTLTDLHRMLCDHNVELFGQGKTSKGYDGYFVRCPRESAHTQKNGPKDCMVWLSDSGAWQARCVHESCNIREWSDFRDAIGWQRPVYVVDNSVDISGLISQGEIKKLDEPFPEECLSPPGLLAEIIKWNLSTALYPLPKLALAGALALMSVITGRKVTDKYKTRTNMYIVGMAPSGAGKEHARTVNKELLIAACCDDMLGPERIGSSAGLTGWVQAKPSILFQIDEVGKLLDTMANPAKSPHLYNIGAVLMQLYSSSGSKWIGDAYADKKKTPVINQPHAVLYGTTTPEGFWKTVTTETVSDGFLGRILAIEDADGELNRDTDHAVNPWLVDSISYWARMTGDGGNLDSENPVPRFVEHSPEAAKRFEDHMEQIRQRRKADPEHIAALWARSGGKAGKLALLFACSRMTGQHIAVEACDVDLAIKLSNWLTRQLVKQVDERVADTLVEMNRKKFLRVFAGGPLTGHELCRKTPWLVAKTRRDMIEDCIERGELGYEQIESTSVGGRPGHRFFRQ